MDLYAVRNELSQGRTVFELPLRVTYYARVSSSSDEQLHSLAAQADYYQELIAANAKWQYVAGYIDEGLSGTSVKKRRSFLRMMEDARDGRFDFIITKEVSRFARNTLDSIRFTQELLSLGVGVLFQSDHINTLLPDSELRLTIMASVAQDEVRKTSERVRFGFKRAIEKGVVLGSDRIWGYRKDQGRLVIVAEEAELVRRIFTMFALERLGIRRIAARLNEDGYRNSNGREFGFSSIAGILANPKYKGWYCGNKTRKVDYKLDMVKRLDPSQWVMYEDHESVPPIVSEELWQAAAELREQRSRQYGKSGANQRYPLSGKLFCAEHGVPFYRAVYKYASGDKEVWQCKLYAEQGRRGCQAPVVYGEELTRILLYLLARSGLEPAALQAALLAIYDEAGSVAPEAAAKGRAREELAGLRLRQDKLLDLNLAGRIGDAEFTRRNDELNRRLEELRQALSGQKSARPSDPEPERAADLSRLIAAELDFSGGFEAGLVDALLARIEISAKAGDEAELLVYPRLSGEKEPPVRVGLALKPRRLLNVPQHPYYPRQC
ncbi:MAG: recombinase family protein [Clostridia bacterium]|nr:recombinase family protein [Clostridia bacterium]